MLKEAFNKLDKTSRQIWYESYLNELSGIKEKRDLSAISYNTGKKILKKFYDKKILPIQIFCSDISNELVIEYVLHHWFENMRVQYHYEFVISKRGTVNLHKESCVINDLGNQHLNKIQLNVYIDDLCDKVSKSAI